MQNGCPKIFFVFLILNFTALLNYASYWIKQYTNLKYSEIIKQTYIQRKIYILMGIIKFSEKKTPFAKSINLIFMFFTKWFDCECATICRYIFFAIQWGKVQFFWSDHKKIGAIFLKVWTLLSNIATKLLWPSQNISTSSKTKKSAN